MIQADRIRSYVIRKVLEPARAAGRTHVTIRAGDVHRMMGLTNVYPAVCSVLRGGKLQLEGEVLLLGQDGPRNGANVLFRYDLCSAGRNATIEGNDLAHKLAHTAHTLGRSVGGFSLSDETLVLVSCSKAKLMHAAPARELYCSSAFQMKRAIIEKAGSKWVILSAKHGILEPDKIIAPYDLTLNSMGASSRRAWARNVLPTLLSYAQEVKGVVVFASQRYAENLVRPIAAKGISISEPLRGLRQGEQLAWLSLNQ